MDRFVAYEVQKVGESDYWAALAQQLQGEPEGGELRYPLAIHDQHTGAVYWVKDEAALLARDLSAYLHPSAGELWEHEQLGEVEIAEVIPGGTVIVRYPPGPGRATRERVALSSLKERIT